MQKFLLWLFFTVMLSLPGLAQTNSLPAKWTNDQKVVLENLPTTGQSVLLPIRADLTYQKDLKSTCEKMSDKLSTWTIADDEASFIITLNRELYPQWTQQNWEVYINRLLSVYLPKV
jgi:hypothetical protein